MHREIKRAIARIKVGASRGTGAFVHNHPPTLLTALHVIADTREPNTFELEARLYGREATLRFGDPDDGGVVERKARLDPDTLRALPELDLCLITFVEAPPARSLPVFGAALRTDGVPFETYGFPDAAPEKGLVIAGSITDAGSGQLYAPEAAAGVGLSVAGLSGAPCLVHDTVVGVIVESLGASARGKAINVGGALFVRDVAVLHEHHPEHFAWWGPSPSFLLANLLPAQFEVLTAVLGLAPEELLPPSASRLERAKEVLDRVGPNALVVLRDALRRVGGIPA